MKIINFLILTFALMACSPEVHYTIVAHNCTQAQEASGVRITCPDGSSTFVANGIDGAIGATGAQGPQGLPGQNGTNGTNGNNGTNGSNGTNGTNGTNGSNGHNALITSVPVSASCTALLAGTDWNDNGALDNGEISVSTQTCDGAPAPAFTAVSYVNFCSPPKNWSEVGIVVGNDIIALFAEQNGNSGNYKNPHLAVLVPGSYTTTDGYSCNFSLLSDGSILH